MSGLIDKRERVEALINKALDSATGEQEARNCAMSAVRLIREHKMLERSGEPVYVVAASAHVAATAVPVERPSGEYGPPGTNPRNANGHRIGCPCEKCDSLPSDEKRTRYNRSAYDDEVQSSMRNAARHGVHYHQNVGKQPPQPAPQQGYDRQGRMPPRPTKPRRASSVHQRCPACGAYCMSYETQCAVCGSPVEALE